MEQMCRKCCGGFKIMVGVLLLLWFWKFPAVDWRLFFGGLLVVVGLLKQFAPKCPVCQTCCQMPPKGKKR